MINKILAKKNSNSVKNKRWQFVKKINRMYAQGINKLPSRNIKDKNILISSDTHKGPTVDVLKLMRIEH